MTLRDLVIRNRSYRRFDESHRIDEKTLKELIDLARCSASSTNRQALRFMLSCEPERNAKIFKHLTFARQLNWSGPAEGERPSGYIIILGDKEATQNFGCDHGIAAQSILLGAVEKGLGGVMLGSAKRPELMASLNIPEKYEILLVLALGKPKETVVIETVGPDGKTAYWRDDNGVHHVPKRRLEDVIVG
ncbi:MAG: nitroreductase family protein [Chloroflexi bacterium]|nr:nitroreductase family protein [Chloroflexota bacterium]